ncbi:MAG: RNA polymerase sigma factor [Oscillospiraceae bacterium]|nr:RNA polymerase sigma factor [Oscillospiraceae bacterium]
MLFGDDTKRACDQAIAAIAQGDKDALTVLYHSYAKMICSVANSILAGSDDVEDVLQETMLRVIKYAKNYRAGSNPAAWVLSIARNCAKDMAANRPPRGSLSIDGEEAESLKALCADGSLDLEEAVIVRDALKTLSPEETAIVKLKYYYGFSYKEIAFVLETTAAAVNKKGQRAIKKLQSYFKE